jgi:hypothetical protein
MKHAVGGIAILVDTLAAALKRVEAADYSQQGVPG